MSPGASKEGGQGMGEWRGQDSGDLWEPDDAGSWRGGWILP